MNTYEEDVNTLTEPFLVRPGELVELPVGVSWWERDRDIHAARLSSALENIDGAVAVLQSAVILWGGRLRRTPRQAHVWVRWSHHGVDARGRPAGTLAGGQRRMRLDGRPVAWHAMALDPDHVTTVNGLAVTDLEQTILQCARFLGPDDAKTAVESLAPLAVGRDEYWRDNREEITRRWRVATGTLVARLRGIPGERGVRQAAAVLRTSSAFSESAYESEFHRIALAAGYLDVEPQMKVRTHRGPRWVDFGIPRARVGFDISGDVKYEGADGDRYALEQMERDDDIREAGVDLVNLTSHDVDDTSGVLRLLDDRIGETRADHGIRELWTRGEERRYGW